MELLILIFYAAICTLIGWFSRHSSNDEDYAMGERKISYWYTVMTIFSTLVTESVIFFSVALTVMYGAWGCIAASAGPALALVVLSYLAPAVRGQDETNRYYSIVDFCRNEWGKGIGQLARFLFLLLLAWVTILQIKINGDLLSGMMDWPATWSTLATVGLVLFYTIAGGYRSVIKTDFFQGILLLVFFILPVFIQQRPDITVALNPSKFSINVVFLFLMSFCMTITRPEMWQRIYSAGTATVAVRSLRIVAVLYFLLGCFLFYYAVSIVQALPDASPTEAFARGYKVILPALLAALFPVLLLAAMMSSLDSAAFLLSVHLTDLSPKFSSNKTFWSRISLITILVGGGALSLTIFNTLGFAYMINGIVALLTLPILLSLWLRLSKTLISTGIIIGVILYSYQIIMGRIAHNPSEAALPALATGLTLILGYGWGLFQKKSGEKILSS